MKQQPVRSFISWLRLPTAAATMHALNGSAATSSVPGEGTTITLRFPLG